jgi:abortive infection bacteriophage resistance protein
MVAYEKPWLSVEEQVAKLASRGVDVHPEEDTTRLLRSVGYYRLTGYLYPFRRSEPDNTPAGQRVRVLNDYRAGTRIDHAAQLIAFDRRLRLLVLDGVERIEVAVRMQVGYVLGRRSPFAHLDLRTFTAEFTKSQVDLSARATSKSKHEEWLQRVDARRRGSDEAFVAHFRNKYDDEMPIWALTEILELGHLASLYRGLDRPLADEIARSFGAPTKKVMTSWLASLNYTRNVAAHHARLFNRKLQNAPGRPARGAVPLLDHLRDAETAKQVYGVYNALAVIAYLLRSVDADCGWERNLVALVRKFPSTEVVSLSSMGFPDRWDRLPLWAPPSSPQGEVMA